MSSLRSVMQRVVSPAVVGFVIILSAAVLAAPQARSGQPAGATPPRPNQAAAAPAPARGYTPPRTRDGQPDLTGIWQSMNAAAFNLEDHSPSMGMPGGYGVVVGGKIPYLPAALQQRQKNFENRATDDPEAKCYQPGVPRATFMQFPFQIIQFPDYVAIFYEYLGYTRTVF